VAAVTDEANGPGRKRKTKKKPADKKMSAAETRSSLKTTSGPLKQTAPNSRRTAPTALLEEALDMTGWSANHNLPK